MGSGSACMEPTATSRSCPCRARRHAATRRRENGVFSPGTGDNTFRRNAMKNAALKVWLTAAVLIPLAVYAQPRPGNPTTATVITKAEIDKISATEQNQTTRDENARVVDIGDGWSHGVGHRSSLEAARADGRGGRSGWPRSWQCPGGARRQC